MVSYCAFGWPFCVRPCFESLKMHRTLIRSMLLDWNWIQNPTVGLGISSAVQQLVKMKTSHTNFGIPIDPAAPVDSNADCRLVVDIYQAVPELTEKS